MTITPNTILLPINKESDDSYGEAANDELLRRGWSKRKKKKSKYNGKGPEPA